MIFINQFNNIKLCIYNLILIFYETIKKCYKPCSYLSNKYLNIYKKVKKEKYKKFVFHEPF